MKKIFLLAPIVILLIFSCEKDIISQNDNKVKYFPNTIGAHWKYERFDSLQNSLHTLTVSIIGDTLISGDSYLVWIHDYQNRTEKYYVLQPYDSIKIFISSINLIDQLYITPFNLNKGWRNPDYYADTSFVSKFQNVEIENIKYSDVVLIVRSAFSFNDYLIEKIWIKPYLGLIKLERKHYCLGPIRDETWKLIESSIE